MKFNQEETKLLNSEKDSAIKPKIPNNSICEFMVTDLRFSDNAVNKAKEEDRELSFVYDSFTLRLAITAYLKEEEDRSKSSWINLIDYKSKSKGKIITKKPEQIVILEPDMYLSSHIVLNKYYLQNCRVKEPVDEITAVKRYALALEQSIGIEYETAVNLMLYTAKENGISVTYADLGITSVVNPIWETIVFLAYRRIKNKKKDNSIYTVIETYDKDEPLSEPCQIYDADISTRVQEILLELAEKRKAERGEDSPF